MVRTYKFRYSNVPAALEHEVLRTFLDDRISTKTHTIWPFFVYLMQSDARWANIYQLAFDRRWDTDNTEAEAQQFYALYKLVRWFDNVFTVIEDGEVIRYLNPYVCPDLSE